MHNADMHHNADTYTAQFSSIKWAVLSTHITHSKRSSMALSLRHLLGKEHMKQHDNTLTCAKIETMFVQHTHCPFLEESDWHLHREL